MKNNGFTLIELIIVVAIIAILSAVLAPQYLQYVERSRESNDIQVANTIIDAAQIAIADPSNKVAPGTFLEISWATNGKHSIDGSIIVRAPVVASSLVSNPGAHTNSSGTKEVDEAISLILGVDQSGPSNSSSYNDHYHGMISDAQSEVGNSIDLIFHINTSTGDVAIANESVKWVSELGMNLN